MLGVMSVTVLRKAGSAKVKVIAGGAMDEFDLGQFLHTAVACADARIEEVVEDGNHPLLCLGSRCSRLRGCRLADGTRLGLCLGLGGDTLRRAVHNRAVLHGSFDQPVIIVVANLALVDTPLAQIVVAIIARGAMEVRTLDDLVTAVAADGVVGTSGSARQQR